MIVIEALFLLATATGIASVPSKIDAPQSIRAGTKPMMDASQVRSCLLIAKEISDLSDQATVAKGRGDNDAYNQTVDPYNGATSRWNAICTKAYRPADMVKAENDFGMRLCKFTNTPCMSESERSEILANESARQSSVSAGSVGLQKSAGRGVKKSIVASADEATANSSSTCIEPKPTDVDLDVDAAFAIDRSAATIAQQTAKDAFGSPKPESPELNSYIYLFEETYKQEVTNAVRNRIIAAREAGPIDRVRIISRIIRSNKAAEAEESEQIADIVIRGGRNPQNNALYRNAFYHAYQRRLQLEGAR